MISAPSSIGGEAEPVRATLTAAEAAAVDWQCIVVGAGPAGAATAITLARRGRRVLLVDRSSMPRPKVCGCCLSPLAVAELAALGPCGTLPAPMPLSTVCVSSAARSARLPMTGGGVLSRESLDAGLLRQAIAVGADWLPDMLVEAAHDAPPDPRHALVTVVARTAASGPPSPWQLHGRVAVLATGLVDNVRIGSPDDGDRPRGRTVATGSRIGVGATVAASTADAIGLPADELLMAVHAHGYCGLVRLEDGRLDLAAAIDGRALAGGVGPGAAIATLLAESAAAGLGSAGLEHLLAALPHASFRATPALTHRSPPIAGAARRIFRVGDAAAYVEPFTGEGIGWALAGGRLLANALLEDIDTAANRYRSGRRRLFGGPHARCRVVARGVRRPELVAAALILAQRMPWAARKALRVIVGAIPTPPSSSGRGDVGGPFGGTLPRHG